MLTSRTAFSSAPAAHARPGWPSDEVESGLWERAAAHVRVAWRRTCAGVDRPYTGWTLLILRTACAGA